MILALLHTRTNQQCILSKSKGFSLVEIITVVAIISILAAMSIPSYQHFVGKAKITVAQATLLTIRETLLNSITETNTSFPATIDFTTGVDDQGRTIFHQPLREQISKDLLLSSLIYTGNPDAFTLTAQANDPNHTILVLTENSLNIQKD